MQGLYVVGVVFLFCLLQHTDGYCCFRDPLILTPQCGCPEFDTPCGVIKCPKTCADTVGKPCNKPACSNTGNKCDCGTPTYPIGASFCGCGVPCCSSYRDTSNVCFVYDNPSPMCSCLKAVNDFDCGCEEMKSLIYFPEVEYPVFAVERKPFFYSGCYSY